MNDAKALTERLDSALGRIAARMSEDRRELQSALDRAEAAETAAAEAMGSAETAQNALSDAQQAGDEGAERLSEVQEALTHAEARAEALAEALSEAEARAERQAEEAGGLVDPGELAAAHEARREVEAARDAAFAERDVALEAKASAEAAWEAAETAKTDAEDRVAELEQRLAEAEAARISAEAEAGRARENLGTLKAGDQLLAQKARGEAEELQHLLSRAEAAIEQLQRVNAQLRTNNAALRGAIESGLSDPSLVDMALKAELDALKAARAADRAELDSVLAALAPALKEAGNA